MELYGNHMSSTKAEAYLREKMLPSQVLLMSNNISELWLNFLLYF
jgi:hypothetical protein